MSTNKQTLAVLIPMYNEEKNAAKCIDAVIKVLDKLKRPNRLIVVNDGSNDKTALFLDKKAKEYKKQLIVLTHKKNKGFGGATQTGINYALNQQFTWILHMDSDLTNNPKYIKEFEKFIPSTYDCVKASRYIKGSQVIGVPKFRRIVSIIGNHIAAIFFHVGIKDCTNGFRMTRVELLKNKNFKENDFSIILEELYYLKRHHARFIEIPYVLTSRINSLSHFQYKPGIYYNYFKYGVKALFLA